MNWIFLGLFILSLGLVLLFSISEAASHQVIARLIVGVAISVGGIAVVFAGTKRYFFQELIDELKKLNESSRSKPL
jgi:succinate-acetate transporter protein